MGKVRECEGSEATRTDYVSVLGHRRTEPTVSRHAMSAAANHCPGLFRGVAGGLLGGEVVEGEGKKRKKEKAATQTKQDDSPSPSNSNNGDESDGGCGGNNSDDESYDAAATEQDAASYDSISSDSCSDVSFAASVSKMVSAPKRGRQDRLSSVLAAVSAKAKGKAAAAKNVRSGEERNVRAEKARLQHIDIQHRYCCTCVAASKIRHDF